MPPMIENHQVIGDYYPSERAEPDPDQGFDDYHERIMQIRKEEQEAHAANSTGVDRQNEL